MPYWSPANSVRPRSTMLSQYSNRVEDDVDIALRRPPVRDRRAEGHLACVDRSAEVDRTVRDDRLTKAAIEPVQLALWGCGRAIAKAHDVQTRFRQKLEI